MLEKQISEIWGDYLELPITFEVNAFKHFKMIAYHEYSELFEQYRPEVRQTYLLVKNNITLALLSEIPYVRALADFISKNQKPKVQSNQEMHLRNTLSMI